MPKKTSSRPVKESFEKLKKEESKEPDLRKLASAFREKHGGRPVENLDELIKEQLLLERAREEEAYFKSMLRKELEEIPEAKPIEEAVKPIKGKLDKKTGIAVVAKLGSVPIYVKRVGGESTYFIALRGGGILILPKEKVLKALKKASKEK
ncbi:hypothetical protein DRN74_01265 [Candidatus Micrarchaeota archaeon]|nr:MAG: hypothetical protein DRN74_01265 [Candidatus Micrarchaeota archaeon]